MLFHSHFFVPLAPFPISLHPCLPHELHFSKSCSVVLTSGKLSSFPVLSWWLHPLSICVPRICLLLHVSYTDLVGVHWFDLNYQYLSISLIRNVKESTQQKFIGLFLSDWDITHSKVHNLKYIAQEFVHIWSCNKLLIV